MSGKKLTDNEIIKALECCIIDKNCSKCPHYNNGKIQTRECLEMSIKLALDLINRLQAENKRLSTLAELGNTRANDYRVMRDRALKAEAENERLTIRLRKVEHQLDDATKMYNTIKAEAYKEFAEKSVERVEKAKSKYQRLCKEQGEEMEEHMHIHFNGIIKIINNLLKEMAGEDNG